ncbi:MAG: glycosyltransferase, partial [Nanoarchaeota archaeon]
MKKIKEIKVSVVLATYNERDNIIPLIAAVIKNLEKSGNYDFEIVVVDDSSPDGTSEVVRKAYAKNKKVRLITRHERGLATAIRRGVEESKGDVIVMMDTDFSHDPLQLPELVGLALKYGVGNGS